MNAVNIAFAKGICAGCNGPINKGDEFCWGAQRGQKLCVDCCREQELATPAAPAVASTFNPSPLQQAIGTAIQRTHDSLMIEAVAGSGKTTTIVWAASLLPAGGRYLFVAFNKSIAEELGTRLPANVQSGTFHSVANRALANARRIRPRIEGSKLRLIVRRWEDEGAYDQSTLRIYAAGALKLVGLAKNAGVGILAPDTPDTWTDLMDHFDVQFGESGPPQRGDSSTEAVDDELGLEIAHDLFNESLKDRNTIDFDDMLYMPLQESVPFQRYDAIFVDEVQDTNAIQRALLRAMLAPGGGTRACWSAECPQPCSNIAHAILFEADEVRTTKQQAEADARHLAERWCRIMRKTLTGEEPRFRATEYEPVKGELHIVIESTTTNKTSAVIWVEKDFQQPETAG